jgi:predicted Zn-dependent protease
MRIRAPLLSLVLSLFVLSSCAGLGGGSFLISEEEEIAMGAEFHTQLLDEMPEYQGDPAVAAWVNALGQQIVPHTDRPDLVYTFTVVDTEEINAFAVPGGYLYVTTGLLQAASSGAEVAGVLAHELGHISAYHGVQNMETYMIAESLGSLLGDEDIGAIVSGALQIGAGLTFDKDQERESDALGVGYAADAGYNPWAIVDFFETLQGLEGGEGRDPDPISDALSGLGELFSTHPPTEERIDNIKAMVQDMGIAPDEASLAWEPGTPLADIQAILAQDLVEAVE